MARSIYIWSYLILKHTFLGRYSQFADGKTLDSEELEKFFKIILLVGEQSGLEIQFCWLHIRLSTSELLCSRGLDSGQLMILRDIPVDLSRGVGRIFDTRCGDLGRNASQQYVDLWSVFFNKRHWDFVAQHLWKIIVNFFKSHILLTNKYFAILKITFTVPQRTSSSQCVLM